MGAGTRCRAPPEGTRCLSSSPSTPGPGATGHGAKAASPRKPRITRMTGRPIRDLGLTPARAAAPPGCREPPHRCMPSWSAHPRSLHAPAGKPFLQLCRRPFLPPPPGPHAGRPPRSQPPALCSILHPNLFRFSKNAGFEHAAPCAFRVTPLPCPHAACGTAGSSPP